MCLSKLSLDLKYNPKANAYTGFGYKKLQKEKIEKYGYKWHRAIGYLCNLSNVYPPTDYKNLRTSVSATTGGTYHNGFHIFLLEEDAKKYSFSYPHPVVKVEYKNVLAFGENKTDGMLVGPCVVAEYMRIVREPKLNHKYDKIVMNGQVLKVDTYYTLKKTNHKDRLDGCRRKILINRKYIVDENYNITGEVGDDVYKDYKWE